MENQSQIEFRINNNKEEFKVYQTQLENTNKESEILRDETGSVINALILKNELVEKNISLQQKMLENRFIKEFNKRLTENFHEISMGSVIVPFPADFDNIYVTCDDREKGTFFITFEKFETFFKDYLSRFKLEMVIQPACTTGICHIEIIFNRGRAPKNGRTVMLNL